MNIFFHVGRYFMLIRRAMAKPEKHSVYFWLIVREIEEIGLKSIGIVVIIASFMGAVISLQTAYNVTNPLVPKFLVGLTARDSVILEFSNTVVSLILAGKVGSNIASQLGTMRVTQQIDALEIMGINSASYLIFPKIIAALFISPFLNIIAIAVGIGGGFLAISATGAVTTTQFLYGLLAYFNPFYITYSLVKMLVFAVIIITISSYHGYYAEGGALEVGQASTRGVVYSSILILTANVLLTQILLT